MRMNINNLVLNGKSKVNGDFLFGGAPKIDPIVFTENEKGVFYFDDEFNRDSIRNLINDIEMYRQNGYKALDLYFQSNGGDVDYLFTLADYINNLPEDFEVTFLVNGMVASAGIYILFMIKYANIIILESGMGMLHLADCRVSGRAMYDTTSSPNHKSNKFVLENLNRLNEFLDKEYVENLQLNDEDKKHVQSGEDLYLHKNELEELLVKYKNRGYFKSEAFAENIALLENQLCAVEDELQSQLDLYREEMGVSFYEQQGKCECGENCEICNCVEDIEKIGGTE
ncbi:MAG: ATP-dependent Clp protease proteolytic subunit [Clostridium sp.]|uniref:ATP-dependent Clp protease proteolytic subunit n=1 Tax=Clostridium sp. TaxID=1506 RepID=UPI003EE54143